ncbi:glycoside hydrolase family 9 protein [Aestuariibius sp. 2305UL40-4]|uniref:glycoside hydrolase family 9 protein n=1 Tax=Aestuariibius violaceus TaxID=3234132 RepID=UPI00345E8EB5
MSENSNQLSESQVDFSVKDSWNGGYVGSLVIQNTSSDALDSWSIVVRSDDLDIKDSWGMTATDLGDGTILLEGSGYGASLEPGQTISVGFTASGDAPDTLDIVSPPQDPAPDDTSPFDSDDYAQVLDLSMDFYYAQYSGDLDEDHPIEWRGDSGLEDGADVGRDLTGGFYDAGDHVKFGLPQAYTSTILSMGALEFEDGYRAAGSYNDVVAHVSWVTDYLLRSYDDNGTADLSDDVFYGQVGNPEDDHAYWGAAEDMDMERPAYAITADQPGTEVTAQAAAALASGALLMRETGDDSRADTLIEAAESLFAFSVQYQGTYTDAIPEAADFYGSHSGYEDEIAWAATWLYEATGDEEYLAKAEEYYQPSGTYWAMTWDDQSMATALKLAEFTGDQKYLDDLDQHFDHWLYVVDRLDGTDTNNGLAWIDEWGSNRYAANTAFLALDYAQLLRTQEEDDRADELTAFARDQIDYMLGDNPDEFSYVVGFGDDFAQQPHHRGASGTDHVGADGDNLYDLNGALVGGPDQSGNYVDDRTDYVGNEVAIDYNAAFSGALAGLLDDSIL